MRNIEKLRLEHLLFLDIETVPQAAGYSSLDENTRYHWNKKANILSRGEEMTPEALYERAGIYAEFGKIVCISVGFILPGEGGPRKFRSKSFAGHDEKKLLQDFCNLLNNHYHSDQYLLVAHNGKEFDFPYIARRVLINGLKLPYVLDIAGKKPWEIRHLDTMELWKFGDYKSFTSLDLLTHVFGIPTPKGDIDGSQVGRVYWEEGDVDRIKTYCQKDTLTVAQLLLKYRGEELIDAIHFHVAD